MCRHVEMCVVTRPQSYIEGHTCTKPVCTFILAAMNHFSCVLACG